MQRPVFVHVFVRGLWRKHGKLTFLRLFSDYCLTFIKKLFILCGPSSWLGFQKTNQPLKFRGFAATLLIKAAHQNHL